MKTSHKSDELDKKKKGVVHKSGTYGYYCGNPNIQNLGECFQTVIFNYSQM